jgi:DNA adenine methylase
VVSSDQLDFEPGDVRPFLRWAGSKRRLLKHLIPFIPTKYGKFYEPFLGGGSMFFYLCPARAEISDVSTPLIEIYRAVRRRPEQIIKFLRPLRPTKSAFNEIKTLAPRNDVERAGSFIFLNRACWNGLFRVNSDGIFNVPYGRPKTDNLIDERNFRRCAVQLRRRSVTLRCQDFEEISSRVAEGDFVYFDPPYVTTHNMNGFVDWNERLFSWRDQIRLAALAKRLIAKGVNVLVTNANHRDIQELYRGLYYEKLVRISTLAGDKSRRVQTSEAIFAGGPNYVSDGLILPRNKVSAHGSNSVRRAD